MKSAPVLLFRFLFLAILITSTALLHAQDITGIWRGYFITATGEQYRIELQVEQKNGLVSGVTYSYLDTQFYGKATAAGRFSSQGKNALVQEIRTVELRMRGSSVACIMKYNLNYVRSGREEFLEGTYTSKYEKSSPVFGIRQGGDCGGGRVYLRRVTTSDFYIEPFLRNKKPANEKPPVKQDPPVKKPEPKKVDKPNVKPPVKQPEVKELPRDTAAVETKPIPSQKQKVITDPPEVLKKRANELVRTIYVESDKITVKLYDNGEIDDDTISVYLNNRQVLSRQRLTANPLVLEIEPDYEEEYQNLAMVAENLGRIPPNTSLMLVYDGDKRYDIRITSTEQKNAVVRFRFQKK